MKSFYKLALATAAAMTLASCSSDEAYEFAYLYEDLPFEMEQVQRPQIPDLEVNIVDFGGVGDGVTLNSDAFAKAIDALSQQGGGKVVVPAYGLQALLQ